MITEIYIESRRVDVTKDISSLLTFALDDVKEFASRSTVFSKTIVLPGTANNNDIFGNIFDTSQANGYDSTLDNIGYNFNAAKSARCLIFQDNLQTFKGTARLMEVIKEAGSIEYEVALNGELTSLSVALSSAYLTDLDFSAYDCAYNPTNIESSWDTFGSGVYFPLIDYGTYSVGKHDWDIRTFRPALYVKEYIDKMFDAAGFRYQSDLMDGARFKKLIIPHNRKKLTNLRDYTLDVKAASAGYTQADGLSKELPFPIQSTIAGFTANGSSTQFTRSGADITGTATLRIAGTWFKDTSIPFVFSVMVNGVSIHNRTWESYVPSTPQTVDITDTFSISIHTGDVVTLVASNAAFGTATGYLNLNTGVAQFTIAESTLTEVELRPNETIVINDTIPKNIRQVDFLTSIVKLFNLYVYEDKLDERLIYITPYIDFYSVDPADSVDWTYKLNRNQPIRIKPMSELNSKIYKFNYKDDSDYYNELYKKRYNQGYGSYTYDSEFEFASQTSTLELIFASTPLVGYDSEDKVYPTIFKRTGSASPVEENTDSVIRIMQTAKKSCASWDIKDASSVLASLTTYGYAGHFDDPDLITDDLNFGALEELFFKMIDGDLSNHQFNVYWSAYMAEITDKDSKLLIAKFYLTPKDIFELDFSRYVYVDGVLYRLNKITDYNASIPSDCTCELIRVLNTSYTWPPINQGGDDHYLLWKDGPTHPLLDSDTQKMLYE